MISKPVMRLAQRVRVPLGFVVAAVFFVEAQPSWISLTIGTLVAIGGVLVRAWASGHLRKMSELTTSGPYAHTRNPLYVGTALIVIGLASAGRVWWLSLAVCVTFLLVYIPVVYAEVDTLRVLFPGAYDEWASAVPLIVPRFTPAVLPGSHAAYDPKLYRRYREYRVAIGFAAAVALLAAKLAFRS